MRRAERGIRNNRWLRTMAFMLGCAGSMAIASDRPFLATASAAAEEDDDNVWSVEVAFQRQGSTRALVVAPEYAFSPTSSLQIELAGVRERMSGETSQLAEIEFKQLFNHIARDDYGWGLVASLGYARSPGASLRRDQWGLALPVSVSLWEGSGLLHLNAGFTRPRGERREWNTSVALEREVWKRTTLFGELARLGDATLVHAGVRHWVRREKLAMDVSLQRARGGQARESGFVIGLGWYDL
jgi:hypothetical protein